MVHNIILNKIYNCFQQRGQDQLHQHQQFITIEVIKMYYCFLQNIECSICTVLANKHAGTRYLM